MNTLKLSICVVTYESLDMVKKFHTELTRSLEGYSEWEVLYFDNSKSDEVINYINQLKRITLQSILIKETWAFHMEITG